MTKYSSGNTSLTILGQKVKELNTLMAAVIIVLFIGFGTMFITVFGLLKDSQVEKSTTYQSLRDEVSSQNERLDSLTKTLQNK